MTRSEELIAKIKKLAVKLGKEGTTTTDGLDEAALGTLHDTLAAEVAAADAAEKNAKKAEAAGEPAHQYFVTEGNAITSKKGIIDAGEEVKPEHVHDGVETLDKLVESGHVRKA